MLNGSADVATSSWEVWLAQRSAVHPSLLSQVRALVQHVCNTDERTLRSQLDSFVCLFQLRELLSTLGSCDVVASSGAPFYNFLCWAYGAEEAVSRNTQLQRLAHWFHYSTDLAFFDRICSGATATNATSPSPRRRISPLSISYFYLLSPRLPELRRTVRSDEEMEARLHDYLSLRPIDRLRVRLTQDFIVHKRVFESVGDDGGIEHSEQRRDAIALATLSEAVLHAKPCNQMASTSESLAASSALEDVPMDEAREEIDLLARMPSAGSIDSDNTVMQEALDDSEESTLIVVPSNRSSNSEASASSDSDTQSDHPVSKRRTIKATGSSRKRKAESSMQKHDDAPVTASSEAVTPAAPGSLLPSLTIQSALPIELICLGVNSWLRKRRLLKEDAPHRIAMDGALVDLMWELAETLSDGDRLQVPEFKRARRSASRDAATAHHRHMEGERGANMLLNVLAQHIKAQEHE